VAIPADAGHARPLVACIAALATQVNSAAIKIGNETYADSSRVDCLERALRELLP
jgi:hypothetical protein